jgi:hypothetical protein
MHVFLNYPYVQTFYYTNHRYICVPQYSQVDVCRECYFDLKTFYKPHTYVIALHYLHTQVS